MTEFVVFTDGSCKNNPGKGSYAYVVFGANGVIISDGSGYEKETTNNQMELIAVIESIRAIEKTNTNYKIKICSDSAYVVNCFNDNWIEKWKNNGWVNSKKEPVLNRELWETLDELVIKNKVVFERISRREVGIKMAHNKAREAFKKLS